MISIITTVDLKYRPFDILRKVERIRKESSNFAELVISHFDRNTIFDALLKRMISGNSAIKLISLEAKKNQPTCNSRLRNIAVSSCSNELILLLDIDIDFDFDFIFEECFGIVDENYFSIYPCVYLSKFGTKHLDLKGKEYLIEKIKSADERYYTHVAMPSSIIVMKKRVYLAVNGFDERYIGYGYEDLDFMIRVTQYLYEERDVGINLIDKPYLSVMYSIGFRKWISLKNIENLMLSKYFLHRYHPSNRSSDYYSYKRENKKIFDDKFPCDQMSEIDLKSTLIFSLGEESLSILEKHRELFSFNTGNRGRIDTVKQKVKYIFGK
ncbi:hypothetical protein GCE9029_01878 [Grimontia celer]|uniref:Glycosyltransferase 2-like prokaryotic type domain-containing protein n=1 Tax=Grimontia celer TaxID=1796497 RepID=A0A128F001_9GAMM|nr:galactosyltransferase-related protein [Grimontia celer]CZF80142.1 hypothetical protein GCE9029_01878 [Grimontia celer]